MTQQSPDPLLDPNRAPTLAGVERAAAKVAALLPQTPLLPLEVDGKTVWCKAECLQPVGAFKIRGAWHRLTDLTAEQAAAGVVGVSSGNHAQGVAWAAKRLGIKATIVMPSNAPAMKLAATRQLGADVILYDRVTESRDAVAARLLDERGWTLIWTIERTFAVRPRLRVRSPRHLALTAVADGWIVGSGSGHGFKLFLAEGLCLRFDPRNLAAEPAFALAAHKIHG
jgi:hypothetical protein